MRIRRKTGCLLALAAPFVFAIVLLLLLHAIGRAHSIWPPRLPDVRLEPSRPVLTEAQVTPDNAYFYIRQMPNPVSVAVGEDAARELPRFLALRRAGEPYPALEERMKQPGPHARIWERAARLPDAQFATTVSVTLSQPWLNPVMMEIKFARVRAWQAIEQNRWDEAARIWSESLRVSDHLTRGGPLVNFMVNATCDRELCEDIRSALLESAPAPGAARELIQRLDDLDRKAEPFVEAVRCERLFGKTGVPMAYEALCPLLSFSPDSETPMSRRILWSLVHRPMWWLLGSTPDRTAAHLDDLYSHLIRAADQSFGPTNELAAICRICEHKSSGGDLRARLDDPVGVRVVAIMFPAWDKAQIRCTECTAALRATEVVLALRLHQAGHNGELPEQLDELVPAWLPAVPRDPFARTDAPLRYRKDGTEWTVYSAGPNGKDDGGRNNWNRRWDTHLDQSDIVFSSTDPARVREEYLKEQRGRRP